MLKRIPGLVLFVFAIVLGVVGCGEFYISGCVLQEVDGRFVGVPGVTIIAEAGQTIIAMATTNEQGFWFMEGVPERVIVHAQKDGFCFDEVYEVWGMAGGVDFIGIPGYEVWGWVKNEKGQPIRGVSITLKGQPDSSKTGYRSLLNGRARQIGAGIRMTGTDEDGFWYCRGLTGPVTVTARLDPRQFSPKQIELTGTAPNVNFVGSYVECSNVQHIFGANGVLYLIRPGESPWIFNNSYYGQWAVQDKRLAGLTSFSGGGWHTVALKSDGTVWSWGNGYCLGAGYFGSDSPVIPVMAYQFSGARQVAGGGEFSLALKDDGTIWFWGLNFFTSVYNQFFFAPQKIDAPVSFVQVGAGYKFSLALDAAGSVWAWGSNSDGQLGVTPFDQPRSAPALVPDLRGFQSLSAGYGHALALAGDGSVWAWGANDYGQLGNGITGSTGTPAKVPNLTGVKTVLADYKASIALKEDGTVWYWGNINYSAVKAPLQVTGVDNAVDIAAAAFGRIYMLRSDGTVWYWYPGSVQLVQIQHLNPNISP